MDNDNNRLNELFNQARNQEPKTPFTQTKEQFLNSSVSLNKVAKGGKIVQFMNLKLIIMITTICAVTVGLLMFSGGSSKENKEGVLVENKEEVPLMDSAIIIEEHEKVVNEYFDKVETLSPILTLNDTNKGKIKKRKHKTIDKTWFLNEKTDENTNVVETVENYRFPTLKPEDWKAHDKQMDQNVQEK